MSGGNFTQNDQCYGAALVVGASGSSSGPVGWREGRITATARTGVGAYTVTMSPGMSIVEGIVICVLDESPVSGREIQWQQTSSTNINVATFAAGVATDFSFRVMVRKIRQLP